MDLQDQLNSSSLLNNKVQQDSKNIHLTSTVQSFLEATEPSFVRILQKTGTPLHCLALLRLRMIQQSKKTLARSNT